jgi:RNA polymerase sigma-70 factor, ECF subfamily
MCCPKGITPMDKPQEKFSLIYDSCVEKIYRFVFLRVNSKELAQDLTSETFAKCWESFKGNPKGIENPRAFLYKIAKNLVADHYRKNSKVQTVSSDNLEEKLTDGKIDLEQTAILASDMDGVRRAMATMNEDYQNAIVWRYLEDMPVREVAQLLDRSEEATRVLLHRAIKDLRTKLS